MNLNVYLKHYGMDGGFSDFHDLVDDKTPTIAIALTESNDVFGGFTKQKLNAIGSMIPDPDLESFIFLLRTDRDKFKHNVPYKWCLKPIWSDEALYGNIDGFGYGEDWWIQFDVDYSYSAFEEMYDIGTKERDKDIVYSIANWEVWQTVKVSDHKQNKQYNL